jgi:hypothetical protein
MRTTTILGLGLIGFILLSLLTIVLASGWIEDDLADRSRNELDAIGQQWADIDVSGRDVTLSGTAPDAESSKNALDAVEAIWGVRVALDETSKP